MELVEIKTNLFSKKSAERRKSAKLIGKMHLEEFGGLLFEAYLKEKNNPATWETKMEMILALGQINFKTAIPEIDLIISKNIPLDIITIAAAKTYVRLTRKSLSDASGVIALLKSGGLSVVTGALMALGEDKMMPGQEEIKELIKLSWDLDKHKDRIGKEFGLIDPRVGLALAAAAWDKNLTNEFLSHCLATYGKDSTLKKVTELALKGKRAKT